MHHSRSHLPRLHRLPFFFFFNDTATTEIYTLSLHDALPIAVYWPEEPPRLFWDEEYAGTTRFGGIVAPQDFNPFAWPVRHDPNARAATLRGPMPGRFGMNGGQTDTYGVPMRPG